MIFVERDFDCIRHILLAVEDSLAPRLHVNDLSNETYDLSCISYHVSLLLDAGYLDAAKVPILGSPYPQFIIRRLTIQGHDYLDTIRDERVWTETKKKFKKSTVALSFDLVKTIASKVALDFLNL